MVFFNVYCLTDCSFACSSDEVGTELLNIV